MLIVKTQSWVNYFLKLFGINTRTFLQISIQNTKYIYYSIYSKYSILNTLFRILPKTVKTVNLTALNLIN